MGQQTTGNYSSANALFIVDNVIHRFRLAKNIADQILGNVLRVLSRVLTPLKSGNETSRKDRQKRLDERVHVASLQNPNQNRSPTLYYDETIANDCKEIGFASKNHRQDLIRHPFFVEPLADDLNLAEILTTHWEDVDGVGL